MKQLNTCKKMAALSLVFIFAFTGLVVMLRPVSVIESQTRTTGSIGDSTNSGTLPQARFTSPLTYTKVATGASYTYGTSTSGGYGDTQSQNSVYHVSTSTTNLGDVQIAPYRNGQAAADWNGIGTLSWNNPERALTVDGWCAWIPKQTGITHYLYVYNWGFSIPTSATITGIMVKVYRQQNGAGNWIVDYSDKLGRNGIGLFSAERSSGAQWNTQLTWYTFGYSSDLWGYGGWTPTDFNAIGYGSIAFDMSANLQNAQPYVDCIQMQVYYRLTYYRLDMYYSFRFTEGARENVRKLGWGSYGHASTGSIHIYLYKFTTSAWTDTGLLVPTSDALRSQPNVCVADYMDSSGNMYVRYAFDGATSPFVNYVDYVYWNLEASDPNLGIIPNGDFEDRSTGLGGSPNYAPPGWINGGQVGCTSAYVICSDKYLHIGSYGQTLDTSQNGYKYVFQEMTNPPKYLAFAVKLVSAGSPYDCVQVSIRDMTDGGKELFYEFSALQGTSSVRPEGWWYDHYVKVFHEYLPVGTWLYRLKDWKSDWTSKWGATPILTDTWRINLVIDNFGSQAAMEGRFDAVWMGDSTPITTNGDPMTNGNFENPGSGSGPDWYPPSWNKGEQTGCTNSYVSATDQYLHLNSFYASLGAYDNAFKYIWKGMTNPPKYLAFAVKLVSAPSPYDVVEVSIRDITAEPDKELFYEFGTGAQVRQDGSWDGREVKVIHEQISAGQWYYRVKDWKSDWTSKWGEAPTISDTYWINLVLDNFHSISAMEARFDAVSMGNWDDGIVNKYALLVGLDYYDNSAPPPYGASNDVKDWYSFLVDELSWSPANIRVYGDGHTENYPQGHYTGDANRDAVGNALSWLASTADGDDIILFAFSGHGGDNGIYNPDNCYLAMKDCLDERLVPELPVLILNGLWDSELKAALQNSFAAKIFLCLMACHSGGFLGEMGTMYNSLRVYCVTPCAAGGKSPGVSEPNYWPQNSYWVYSFLDYSWRSLHSSSTDVPLETIFQDAKTEYLSLVSGMPGFNPETFTPLQCDGNPSAYFYLK